MTAPETGCQCRRFNTACSAQMTQEDLLCDVCRQGCVAAVGVDIGTSSETIVPAMHLSLAPEISFKLSRGHRA